MKRVVSASVTMKEKKQAAQDLIMHQIAIIGYGDDWDEFVDLCGDEEEAQRIIVQQADRVAKLFGFQKAWFG